MAKKPVQKKKTVLPALAKKLLRIVLTALLTALLLAAFYVAVVLGQPQENETAVSVRTDQPLMNASPAVTITEERYMGEILRSFPVPVLQAMSGSGLTFVSGMSYDVAWEDGFARRVTLTYRTPAGYDMVVESIYPARALGLIDQDQFHFSAASGQPLAGMQTVRMEDSARIRLHAQSETGLYLVMLPAMDASDLSAATQSLQLTGGE